jgi:hypothetical protein
MTTQFMRNYIDLINEMQQPQPQQLDEGIMMNAIKKAANYVISNFGPDVKSIANTVKQATGGDATLNKENAAKVMQALGVTPQDIGNLLQQLKKGQSDKQVAESFLQEGLETQIILRLIWAALSAGVLNALVAAYQPGPMSLSTLEGIWLMIGFFTLVFTEPFFDPNA